jgi:hypothetical protein
MSDDLATVRIIRKAVNAARAAVVIGAALRAGGALRQAEMCLSCFAGSSAVDADRASGWELRELVVALRITRAVGAAQLTKRRGPTMGRLLIDRGHADAISPARGSAAPIGCTVAEAAEAEAPLYRAGAATAGQAGLPSGAADAGAALAARRADAAAIGTRATATASARPAAAIIAARLVRAIPYTWRRKRTQRTRGPLLLFLLLFLLGLSHHPKGAEGAAKQGTERTATGADPGEGTGQGIEAGVIHGDTPFVGGDSDGWVCSVGHEPRVSYPHFWGYGDRTLDIGRLRSPRGGAIVATLVPRQRDPQLPARLGGGAKKYVGGGAERHLGLIGRVLLEFLLQLVGVLQHIGQALGPQRVDDIAPGLPGQFDGVHGT